MIGASKISKSARITISKDNRKKWGLKSGDWVILESLSQGILIRRKKESDTDKILDEVSGMWNDHPLFKDKSTKEIIKLLSGSDNALREY